MKKVILVSCLILTAGNYSFATDSQAQICQKVADSTLIKYIASVSLTHKVSSDEFELVQPGNSFPVGQNEYFKNDGSSTVAVYFYKLSTAGLPHNVFVPVKLANCEVLAPMREAE
jgi:hypothetical protein